jgi:hypothetical protein
MMRLASGLTVDAPSFTMSHAAFPAVRDVLSWPAWGLVYAETAGARSEPSALGRPSRLKALSLGWSPVEIPR